MDWPTLFAVLWGLITFSGFVVSLLIPRAEEYFQRYRSTADDYARGVAWRWSFVLRAAPVLVAFVVVVAAIAAGRTASWAWQWPGSENFWLLVLTTLAQLAFAVGVLVLTHTVPLVVPKLNPWTGARVSEYSSLATAINFINETNDTCTVSWLGFDGRETEPIRALDPGRPLPATTFVGHVWRVVNGTDSSIVDFKATVEPAEVRLTQQTFAKPAADSS